ncbi:MAG: hypothetical protein B6U76_09690 [Desulfurococcales archaeon ex4484_217_2]|nr:MAG: hypothetical protein B6U76_09690 [Desulfurococcales archaeon ex4484_217_2]
MAEECSDFVDCREIFKQLVRERRISVYLSKHALERIVERRYWGFKGAKKEVIVDIIKNVFRDGEFKVFADNIIVWTKNYVLICSINREFNIVVKTVITRATLKKELQEKLKKGIRVKWKQINVEIPKLQTSTSNNYG